MRLRCAPAGATATEVAIGIDIAPEVLACAAALGKDRARFALIDARVAALHADPLRALTPRLELAGGEGAKSFAILEDVLRTMARAELDRRAVLVVVGGGSLGDVGGLAASLYARGIDFVLVPTTLLAMVDSSVGGKTAIDLPEGKNLVGTFHPARHVLIDLAFLTTLPDVEFRSGLGELLKIAIGLSRELFELLELLAPAVVARDRAVLLRAVQIAVATKIALVETDFTERGPRRMLNLGHTLGHALEAHSGYTLRHGIAVARGLHFAICVAEHDRQLPATDATRARGLLERFGFARSALPPTAALLPYLRRDKKIDGEVLNFVAPTGIGQSTIIRMPVSALAAQLAQA